MVLKFTAGLNKIAYKWFLNNIVPATGGSIIDIKLKCLIAEQRKEPSDAKFCVFTDNENSAFLLCCWFREDSYSIARVLDLADCQKASLDELEEWTKNGREYYLQIKGAK